MQRYSVDDYESDYAKEREDVLHWTSDLGRTDGWKDGMTDRSL